MLLFNEPKTAVSVGSVIKDGVGFNAYIFDKLSQSNPHEPIDVTDAGMVTVVNESQLMKPPLLMVVTELGMVRFFKLIQSKNVHLPMRVIVLGILKVFNPEQQQKAESPMLVSEEGKLMLDK